MRALNLWRTLLGAALLTTAFTACSDDEKGYSGIPEITVNAADKTVVSGKLAGGATAAVEVVTKGDWTLAFKNPADEAWCTPSQMSGSSGTMQLTFQLAAATTAREAIVTLSVSGEIAGYPITKEATITVKQTDELIPTNALYDETCGTKASDTNGSPAVGTYTGWQRKGSLDQAGVVYSGTDASVRNSGAKYDPAADQTAAVSGPPYVFLNKSSAVFDIKNINIASNRNFTVTFTALAQESYSSDGPVFAPITPSTFAFSASMDGTNFAPVAFTAQQIGTTASWNLCTAMFKLPESFSGSTISIRFDSYSPQANQGLRLDDFKLYEGGTGAELGGAPEAQQVTINQIAAPGYYQVDATIVGVHSKGVMFADNAAGQNNYILAFDNAWTTQTSNPYKDKVNFKAVVNGKVIDQHGLWQYSVPTITVGAQNNFDLGAPALFDAAGITTYANAIKADPNAATYKYVKLSGALTIAPGTSGGVSFNSYTVAVDGLSTDLVRSVTLAYGFDSYYTGIVSGNVVDIEGFALGFDTTQDKLNILVTKVTKNTVVPAITITSTPARFTAAAGEMQDINFNAANVPANSNVFAKLEGDGAAQFTLGAVDKTSTKITVTTLANTSNVSKNATLKLYIATAVDAVADASDEVILTQNPAGQVPFMPITTAPADWSGTYVVGYPSGADCFVLNEKYSGATSNKSTFTYSKLSSPAFDGTNIAYDSSYNTITIAKISGTELYSIKYGDMYVGWTTSTGNSCAFSSTAPSASTPDYQWAIAFDGDGKLITLTCSTNEPGKAPRLFQFNANSGQERFAIYASTQKNIMFYN